MQSTPLDISKRRRKKYCDWLITIYRGDGVGGGDGRVPYPAGKIYIRLAYQLRDTSHRDLVKSTETGARSLLSKRFDGCLMHNKDSFSRRGALFLARRERSAK